MNTPPLTRAELLAWTDELAAALHASAWGPALTLANVDVLDAARQSLYLAALRHVRQSTPTNVTGKARVSLPNRVINRLKQERDQWAVQRRCRRQSAPTQLASVVFWPVELNHLDQGLPISQAMTERGQSVRFVTCRHHVLDRLHQRGIPTLHTKSAWAEAIGSLNQQTAAARACLSADPAVEFPPLRGFEKDAGLRNLILYSVRGIVPFVLESIAATDMIQRDMGAQLLVVGYDLSVQGKAACLRARQLGLPTASIMHGALTGDPCHDHHPADRFLLFGDCHRRYIQSLGGDPAGLKVCGSPSLDQLDLSDRSLNPVLREKLGLTPQRPYVLVATSGPGNSISLPHHMKVIENIAALRRDHPDLDIIVKLHQKDKRPLYESVLAQMPGVTLPLIEYQTPGYPTDIYDWLRGCALLLTGASTVAMEAMVLGVPVISMDFNNEIGDVDFITAGAAVRVTDGDALQDAARRLCDGDYDAGAQAARAAAFVNDYFYKLDGRSSARAADCLLELMSS